MRPIAKDLPGVLLVNPSIAETNYISLAYIAAYVRAHGFRADVIDFSLEKPSPSRLQEICRARQPILIGIAAYQSTMQQVVSAAKLFKTISPAKIVIGGPQVPVMPDEGLRQLADVDFLCRGEGEITTLALLEGLRNRARLSGISGISYKSPSGSIKTTSYREPPEDLDEYPSPYLQNVIDIQAGSVVHILSSRGCPHSCKFCVTPSLSNRRLRVHSIDRVISEMVHLAKKGVNCFWFADPAFSADKARAIRLFDRIVESKMGVRIWCETRYDMVDDKLLSLMKRAGVEKIAFGLETSNGEILQALDKKLDVDKFAEVVKKTKACGIKAEVLHMIGLPGETFDSISATFDYIRRLDIFFEGNSVGNLCNLYFGSESCRAPEKGGYLVSKKIKGSDYPAYLSPGTSFQTRSLSGEGRRKIGSRKANELFLSGCRSRYMGHRRHWGISVQDSFSLPWGAIHMLRANFSVRRSFACAADKAIERFFVISRGSSVSAGGGHVDVLKDALNKLSYDFSLGFIGDNIFFLEQEKILGPLHTALSSYLFLYQASITFTLECDYWKAHRKSIIRMVKHFTQFKLPSPVYDASGDSWGPRKMSRHPLCSLIALLDITDRSDRDLSLFLEARGSLGGAGAAAFLFFDFRGKDPIERFLENIRLLGSGSWIVVGLDSSGISKKLEKVYRDNKPSLRLPILQMINGRMLYPGGRSFYEDLSAQCVYVDSSGEYLSQP